MLCSARNARFKRVGSTRADDRGPEHNDNGNDDVDDDDDHAVAAEANREEPLCTSSPARHEGSDDHLQPVDDGRSTHSQHSSTAMSDTLDALNVTDTLDALDVSDTFDALDDSELVSSGELVDALQSVYGPEPPSDTEATDAHGPNALTPAQSGHQGGPASHQHGDHAAARAPPHGAVEAQHQQPTAANTTAALTTAASAAHEPAQAATPEPRTPADPGGEEQSVPDTPLADVFDLRQCCDDTNCWVKDHTPYAHDGSFAGPLPKLPCPFGNCSVHSHNAADGHKNLTALATHIRTAHPEHAIPGLAAALGLGFCTKCAYVCSPRHKCKHAEAVPEDPPETHYKPESWWNAKFATFEQDLVSRVANVDVYHGVKTAVDVRVRSPTERRAVLIADSLIGQACAFADDPDNDDQYTYLDAGVYLLQRVFARTPQHFLSQNMTLARMRMLAAREWDELEESVTRKPSGRPATGDRAKARAAAKRFRAGQMSKGHSILRDTASVAEWSDDIKEQVKQKIITTGSAGLPSRGDDNSGGDAGGDGPLARTTIDDLPVEKITDALYTLDRQAAAGATGLTPATLAQLHEHGASLPKLVNALYHGKFRKRMPLLMGGRVVPLTKSNGGIRPVVPMDSITKLLEKTVFSAHKAEIADALCPHQLGVGIPAGTECIVHGLREYLRAHRDHVAQALDISNAFGAVTRRSIYDAISRRFPSLAHCFLATYGQAPVVVTPGGDTLHMRDGIAQGGPLSPAYFALATIHALKETDKAHPTVTVVAYLDDTYIVGPRDDVKAAAERLDTEIRRTGLKINEGKTVVIPYGDQTAKFLRYCITTKSGYFMRTTRRSKEYCEALDDIIAEQLRRMMGAFKPLSSRALTRARRPIKQGGLGLRRQTSVAPAAFLGSVCSFSKSPHHPFQAYTTPGAELEAEIAQAIADLHLGDDGPRDTRDVLNHDARSLQQFLTQIMDRKTGWDENPRNRAIQRGASLHGGYEWLLALPSCKDLRMSDKVFRFALSQRIRTPCSESRASGSCYCCGREMKLDHAEVCDSTRTGRHDYMQNAIARAFMQLNRRATQEPSGFPGAGGKRGDILSFDKSGDYTVFDLVGIDDMPKVAFQPPPCSYEVREADGLSPQLWIEETYMRQNPKRHFSPHIPCHVITDIRTRRRSRLCAIYLEQPDSDLTIVFSHGNAVDLGQMAVFLAQLAAQINCSIFAYDYSGYGLSTGSPSEANLYRDIEAVVDCITQRFGVPRSSILLYGQSIGTVPTVDYAARHPDLAGVVLHSPLASGLRVLKPTLQRTYCCDPFPSIEKVHRINMPVLIFHGKKDQVIHFSHGYALHERCPGSANPVWIDSADHNDIEMYPQYIDNLAIFLDQIRHSSSDSVVV
ncbi:hypothetical protein PTSG_04523 [Salpingoeca rosetta]|uniref:Reverse transcriptase domain-containing protein n=1 Tax=Salpingoeca rosetta (strain ATCC 50818 / BSB-021) TaxID=946362 RepID=F2U8T8_SALR5|nr:uncharacterized protein PTSG_04523 [Salpingoeca rosetta]EGD72796.1 hypothetical protein PTSG_04523 [Salpingoeca rosetta]|eukprot:XP_004994619.1 hypothetical protein PTSG_04523 [Salpingoeca rosetta]